MRQPDPNRCCDAHMHVFDTRFASHTPVPGGASVADYQRLQGALGTARAVVVQPRPYGFDNRVTLDAVARLGLARARGVAVVPPDVTETTLQTLHDGGIRGVRFTLFTPHHAPLTFEQVEPVAERIAHLGWHVQLHWTADQIVAHAPLLSRLQVPLVFDHMARLMPPMGVDHPAFQWVSRWVDSGRAWVKLSGAYLCTGPDGHYRDSRVTAVARTWLTAAPERLVWGSDWPHTTEAAHPPHTPDLRQLLSDWCGSDALIHRILVDNPATLYGFDTH